MRRLLADKGGSVAVEFAVVAQLFALVFTGTVDLGVVLMKRIQLDNSLAAAANYALVSSSKVSATDGAALATSLATIVSVDGGTTQADSRVIVNNGPSRAITAGVGTSSGTASDADRCYCPTVANRVVTWGTSTTCGNACASGLRAGKFVFISVSRAHNPIFSNYGMVHAGVISATTIVQTG